MKKYYFLIIVALILGLVLTGCSLLSNISQVPAIGQKGMPLSTADLVALWHFDENSGTIAYDSTDNNNDGTISGASWVDGKLGKALSFDGNDYVMVLDSDSLEPDRITVEAWVKSSGTPGTYKYIVSKYLPTKPGSYSSYGLYTASSGGLRFYIGLSSIGVLSPDAGQGIWDGNWHHVAGTYDGSAVKLYIDGNPVAGAGSTTSDINYEGTGNLFIGSYTTASYCFSGTIDEVRIWDGALTENEIFYSYNNEILHVDDDWFQWPGAYRTINEALAVADDGDTIIVEAGTYNENVTINKSVILQGGTGVLLQGSGSGNGFLIQAANITISGFEITNFAIGIRTYGGPSNFGNLTISNVNINNNTQNGVLIVYDTFGTVTIEDCQINSNSQNGIGISNDAVITELTIENSTISSNGNHGFYLASSDTVVKKFTSTNVTFANNHWEGFYVINATLENASIQGGLIGDNELGVLLRSSTVSDFTMSGVTVRNNKKGAGVRAESGTVDGFTIENCKFDNNIWEHVDLGYQTNSLTISKVNITGNTFTPGDWCSIYVNSTAVFGDNDIEIHLNDFVSGQWGVNSSNSVSVDATCNWWGDDSGPRGEGPGTGDAVSANVDYNPWLTQGSSLVYTGTPQPDTSVVLEATLSDSTSAGIAGMEVKFFLVGDFVGSADTGSDGVARFELGTYAVGVYEVYAEAACDLTSGTEYLAVYDPSAGFVTGGGWIDSPAGASADYPDAVGKATFGFVSKYKKGAAVPTGNTEFQFKAGDLDFHSDSYDWLVIADNKAKYKGTGTINGAGEYGFMLTATDSEPDLFRIKIQDKINDTIIYDNKMNSDDTEYDGTELGGGQIIVHKGK